LALVNTTAEITRVRLMLGDAAEMKAITIVNELRISETVNLVNTRYGQIKSVSGVWAATDPTHAGTDYYNGGEGGSFSTYTTEITLGTSLPGDNTNVLLNYTYFKGLSDAVVDQHVTNAKTFVEVQTNESFDWLNVGSERRANLAIAAMTYRAAVGALIYQFAPDILQKGYNWKLAEFSVESKTWAGSMGIRDLMETMNKEVDIYLALLGVYQPFDIPATGDWRDAYRTSGRDFHGYKMDPDGDVY